MHDSQCDCQACLMRESGFTDRTIETVYAGYWVEESKNPFVGASDFEEPCSTEQVGIYWREMVA